VPGVGGDVRLGSAAAPETGSLLKITLKIGKKTQKEIALLMMTVTKSASVSPVPPSPQVSMSRS
jgi:hypothetical protein